VPHKPVEMDSCIDNAPSNGSESSLISSHRSVGIYGAAPPNHGEHDYDDVSDVVATNTSTTSDVGIYASPIAANTDSSPNETADIELARASRL
jgi:hypothetical protein